MRLCALCGLAINAELDICPHHHSSMDDNWAISNRLICDFVHRGKLEPLPDRGPRDEVCAHAGDRR
jgi:hypothetical protein